MFKLRDDKKAIALNEDIALFISIVFAVLILFMGSSLATGFSDELQDMTPQIRYQYPIVFLNTFLNQELNDSVKIKFSLDVGSKYYVKDLIWRGDDNSISYVNNIFRNEYLNEDDIILSIDYYEKFSKTTFDKNNLLIVSKLDCVFDLNSLDKTNYVFYIRSKNEENYYVFFNNVPDVCPNKNNHNNVVMS